MHQEKQVNLLLLLMIVPSISVSAKSAFLYRLFLVVVAADAHTVHCVFDDAVLHVHVALRFDADTDEVFACKGVAFRKFGRLNLHVP